MQKSFVFIHELLLKIYLNIEDIGDISEKLKEIRQLACSTHCADSLFAYERYLDLIALRLGSPELKKDLTLLDGLALKKAVRRDSSQQVIEILMSQIADLQEELVTQVALAKIAADDLKNDS